MIWLNPGCFDPFQQIRVEEELRESSQEDRARAMKQYVLKDVFFWSFHRRLEMGMISEWLDYYSFEREREAGTVVKGRSLNLLNH